MTLKIEQYSRKSFPVEAVRVTEENMEEVSEWCKGAIRSEDNRGVDKKFIKVRVENPLSERQTKAFVGDWVLYAGKGYKVYSNKAFGASFDKKSEGTTLVQNVFHNQPSVEVESGGGDVGGVNPGGTNG